MASGGSQTIQAYNLQYAHEVPSALDPYLLVYYSMQNEAETRGQIDQILGNVTFGQRNEPE